MKAPGTWIALWMGALCAAGFGAALVAYIWLPHFSTDKHGHLNILPLVIFSGIFAIVFLGASRIEEDEGQLQGEQDKLEKQLEAIRARQSKLRRLRGDS